VEDIGWHDGTHHIGPKEANEPKRVRKSRNKWITLDLDDGGAGRTRS
jgi:hypothetical protein